MRKFLARWLMAMGFLIFAVAYGAVIAVFLASIMSDLHDRESRRRAYEQFRNPTPDFVAPQPPPSRN